jgi:hypothetical protein
VQEQKMFRELFDLWADEKQTDLEKLEVVNADSISLPVPDPKPFCSSVPFWTAILALCLIILVYIKDKPVVSDPVPEFVAPVAPITITATSQKPCEETVEGCGSEPPPPILKEPATPATYRYSQEPIRLNAEQLQKISRWQYVVVGLPLLLWLLYRLYRTVNLRYVLRQESNQQGNPLVYLKLKITQSMPFALSDFSSKLRLSILQSTRKLDADKTIIATIRNAGLFKPVAQQRYFQPEYLILIDRSHSNDQCAALADSLLTRPQLEHLHIRAFNFQGDPNWCFEINKQHAASLQSLAHKFADNRLIVISSGHKLVNRLSGELAEWVSIFDAWQQRVWLTNQPQPWGFALSKIAASGFAVAPLESAGVKASAHWFATLQAGTTSKSGVWYAGNLQQNFPAQLKDKDFWLESEAEKGHKARLPQLVQQLGEYLSEDGMQLLACVAAYPEINGNLSIALEQKLFVNAYPLERERRLLKLSALPWCQQGQMPVYLRAALLEVLSKSEFKRIGQIYRDLFELAGTNEQGLGIQVPGNANSSATVKPFKSHSYPTSEPLMIRALRGWRSRLDFILPNQLARTLGKFTNSPLFSYFSFAGILVVSLFFWLSWPYYQNYKASELVNAIVENNYNIGVIIETDASNINFSEALNTNLKSWGFQFSKTNVDEKTSVSKGQIITNEETIGELVQARIDYLTNGRLKLELTLDLANQAKPTQDMPEEFMQQVETVVRIRLPSEVGQNSQVDSAEEYLKEWYAQRDFVFNLLETNRQDPKAYDRILISELLPRLHNLIASNLNWLLESNAGGQQQVELYEALKAYLMLQTPSRFEADYIDSWLAKTLRSENADKLELSLRYFRELLNLEIGRQTPDLKLVTSARQALSRMTLADLVYLEFKTAANNRKMYSFYELLLRKDRWR